MKFEALIKQVPNSDGWRFLYWRVEQEGNPANYIDGYQKRKWKAKRCVKRAAKIINGDIVPKEEKWWFEL